MKVNDAINVQPATLCAFTKVSKADKSNEILLVDNLILMRIIAQYKLTPKPIFSTVHICNMFADCVDAWRRQIGIYREPNDTNFS
jgi:hypothetical protein